MNNHNIIRTVYMKDLTPSAQELLKVFWRQRGWKSVPTSFNGESMLHPSYTLVLFDALCSDDEFAIRLKSQLTYSERMRMYGVEGLAIEDQERGEDGYLTYRKGLGGYCSYIPCERYIIEMVNLHGNIDKGRRWFIPYDILAELRRNNISGTNTLNLAARALTDFCDAGKFIITQDEAL